MTDDQVKHLSTTALAKLIGKESKELFILLANSGWIVKVDGHWQLTAKGRFEGGTYANHPRYGEYIVWPASISEHPLLRLLPEAPLSARALAQKTGLPARLLNRLLASLGWIKPYVHGWQLTDLGARIGGQQHESESTAIPYVTWPESLLENRFFQRAVAGLKEGADYCQDGHKTRSSALNQIDNWLYTVGIVHAAQYPVEQLGICRKNEETLEVDFYLPGANVALVFWPDTSSPGELAANLARRECLQHSELPVIELEHSQLSELDEVLTRELMKLGVAVY